MSRDFHSHLSHSLCLCLCHYCCLLRVTLSRIHCAPFGTQQYDNAKVLALFARCWASVAFTFWLSSHKPSCAAINLKKKITVFHLRSAPAKQWKLFDITTSKKNINFINFCVAKLFHKFFVFFSYFSLFALALWQVSQAPRRFYCFHKNDYHFLTQRHIESLSGSELEHKTRVEINEMHYIFAKAKTRWLTACWPYIYVCRARAKPNTTQWIRLYGDATKNTLSRDTVSKLVQKLKKNIYFKYVTRILGRSGHYII